MSDDFDEVLEDVVDNEMSTEEKREEATVNKLAEALTKAVEARKAEMIEMHYRRMMLAVGAVFGYVRVVLSVLVCFAPVIFIWFSFAQSFEILLKTTISIFLAFCSTYLVEQIFKIKLKK